jgi:2'-5' RNA ligase
LSQTAQRLFFALWPGASLQKDLYGYAQRMHDTCGGRIVAKDNIHLTLAFLGSQPADRIDNLRAIGASLRADRFRLDLTRVGCWKRSQIGWVAPENVPASLDSLIVQLRDLLSGARIPFDPKPFRPHVTLVRKAQCNVRVPLTGMRFAWSIDRFALVRSRTLQTGSVYSKIDEWPMV